MEVFKRKENSNTVFVRRRNTKEGNKKLYSIFTNQCEPSLNMKLKGNKGYIKYHNAQDNIKTLELITSIVCDVEAHLQGTWAMMKVNKDLYTFSQSINTTNNDYMKVFDAYAKVIKYYGGRKKIHRGLVKANITKMEVQDMENPTTYNNNKAEEESRDEYLAYMILDGADNGCFGTIKTDLEKKWVR